MNNECWQIAGGECLETQPEGYYGFIYMILDDKGRFYIGKKAFTHNKRKKISKTARKKTNTRKRVQIDKVDSGWLNYWGSCKPLLEYIKQRGGTKGFKRYILKFTLDKASTSYWEVFFQMRHEVLHTDKAWNTNILGRFYKTKIHE